MARKKEGVGTLMRLVVVGVVLIIVIVIFVQDQSTRSAAQDAYQKLDKLVQEINVMEGKGTFKNRTTREEVQKVVGRLPDGPTVATGNLHVESYTFPSIIKKYQIFVGYIASGKSLELDKVSFRDPIK